MPKTNKKALLTTVHSAFAVYANNYIIGFFKCQS